MDDDYRDSIVDKDNVIIAPSTVDVQILGDDPMPDEPKNDEESQA